jgi:signal transduction histidine kinase
MMGELSGQQRKALTIVHRSGEELLVLVRDILDLSAIEAGNLEVKRERVPLRSLLEDLCEAFQAQAEGQGLELRPVICDPGVTVEADRERLAQVVRNLLGNAKKFTDQGYVLARAVHAGDTLRVEVEDSGIGIPASEQHRLFQSFQRVNDPHGRMRAGNGLGLSICKRIAEAMGGQVGVDSVPGRGSRFWFTAPVAADEKVPITA